MSEFLTLSALSIVAVGFFVGIVVGLTGMGGGALMTPALILLGFADATSVVTADLTAAVGTGILTYVDDDALNVGAVGATTNVSSSRRKSARGRAILPRRRRCGEAN